MVQKIMRCCVILLEQKKLSISQKQVDDVRTKSKDASESAEMKKGLNSEMTREKEREQEQQKQKQQQQQVESMFARDKSRPYQWSTSLLKQEPLSFEKSMAVSSGGKNGKIHFRFIH